jgi:hypothetical protein
MEVLTPVLQREVMIALAVVGVLAATAGSYMLGRSKREGRSGSRLGRFVLRSGYACTCGSIVIFIVAGFVGA